MVLIEWVLKLDIQGLNQDFVVVGSWVSVFLF